MIIRGRSTTLLAWTVTSNSKQVLEPEVLEGSVSILLERVFGASSLEAKQGIKETSMIFLRSLSNSSQWVAIKSNPQEGHLSNTGIRAKLKAKMLTLI